MSARALARPEWVRRAVPLACGCALAAGAALVALNDPAAPGSRFPGCIFRSTTGLWCPGCGLTRGFHQLFTGHPLAALSYNVFVPFVLVAVVAGWISWTRRCWGRTALRRPPWLTPFTNVALPVLLVAYGVLRNIPAAPFRSLAP
jgi:hypothetical protein